MSSVCCPCQHANPADAKFCNECGQPLRIKPCAQCHTKNYIDVRSCDHCGADLNEAKVASLESVSGSSSVSRRTRAVRTGARFGFDAMNSGSVDHLDPSMLTAATSPSDAMAAANVDFLIFPTALAGASGGGMANAPATVASAGDATAEANVDFLIFPTPKIENDGDERQGNHPSPSLPERRDAPRSEAWGSAKLSKTPPSSSAWSSTRREALLGTGTEALVESAAPLVESAAPTRERRPAMFVLALVLVVGAAAFYGIQYGNPFEESTDRLSQGSMRIGTSLVQPPSEDRPRASDSIPIGEGAAAEQRARSGDISNDRIDPVETASAPTTQGTSPSEARARVIVAPAEKVPERVTTQARGKSDATPATSLATMAGRAKALPVRKPISEPPQRSTAESCADSVAALGLCNVTKGH